MIGRLHVWNDYVISRGGATVLKVGEQNVIRERSEQKIFFCAPTFGKVGGTIFLHVGGTSTEMSIIIKYTEICCLVVALIHIGLS